MAQAGVATPIVALLRMAPTASNETVVQNAASLVCNLAIISTGKRMPIQKAGAIAPLVSLLGAAPGIAAQAAAAL